jgi:N-acetylglucosamine-6-phosphate deacetylase
MIVLSGADLVGPDRIVSAGVLVIDGDRIAEVRRGPLPGGRDAAVLSFPGHFVVPGFIDVHVHGVEGVDTLDSAEQHGGSPLAAMAAKLPRYGVTGFCPTTVACAPEALKRVLEGVRAARESPAPLAARVLPAHLESNFINPAYCGAQPKACLRRPRAALDGSREQGDGFPASDLLTEIANGGDAVGIVTLAPELEGGVDLVRWLTARGHRVSVGHSGATFEEGLEAIAAGARHATHLFNRMPPLAHRAPGLAGAVLRSEEVAAELICDGYHVHPAVVATAVAAKRPSRVMAITDGTALSGLGAGARGTLGGQPIVARAAAAFLADGTIAGSILTMDRAFRMLVREAGLSLVDAVTMCATTAARELGLADRGSLSPGAVADVVILDRELSVVRTYVAGELAYSRADPIGHAG